MFLNRRPLAVLLIMVLSISLVTQQSTVLFSVYAAELSQYDLGYRDGCRDASYSAPIDPSVDPNATNDYTKGYVNGYNTCPPHALGPK